MKPRLPAVSAVAWIALLALLALVAASLLTWSPPALAALPERAATDALDLATRSRALQRAHLAVLGLQAVALEDARSNATLGRARSGSGVLIGADGLVLTIGYLVLEAEQVQLVRDDGRTVPARVLGYDVATGFGLVQALAPLGLEPAPLGSIGMPMEGPPLMIASGGDDGAVSSAALVSRRAFSGNWEYHIEGALFTAPPRRDHSGAGLFNPAGELVGIGALLVTDVAGGGADAQPHHSGNMFVPVDLLLPILDDLRRQGRGAASQRAWLGLNCAEQAGGLRVTRVSDDSPADVAGLQPGDRILRIDGTEVRALATLWQTLWAGGAPEREVTLEIERDQLPQTLKLWSVDRGKTLRRAEGI
jgi:S1-C subfamily serine protease